MKGKIRGLTIKRGKFVYQPPQVDGVRPRAIYLRAAPGDLAAAVLEIDQIQRQAFERRQTEPAAEFIDRYLAAKRNSGQHKSRVTTQTAAPALNRFKRFFRQPIDTLTARDLERWRDAMLAERRLDADGQEIPDQPALSRATLSGYLRYTQSFFSWLVEQKIILRSPFEDCRALFPRSIPTRREQFCPKPLRDRLIRECDDVDLKAVLFFGFHAGLRRGEILNLRPHWIEVDADGRACRVHVQNETGSDGTTRFTIKDNEPKRIPLTDPLIEFLESDAFAWRRRRPYLIRPDIAAGRAVYRYDYRTRMSNYMRAQGCPWVTTHTLRHTFITLLLSAPADRAPSLLQVSRWTGTSVEVLQKSYAHLIEDRSMINAAL